MLCGVSFLFVAVPVLVNVAFFTLLERKILGLSQTRKGPNKVSYGGLLQPFSDAVKLFLKEYVSPFSVSYLIFLFAPMLALMIVLLSWWLIPMSSGHSSFAYSSALFLIFLAMNIYPVFLAGWASNSKYALVGSTRAIAQSVSYEISLAVIMLAFLVLGHGLGLNNLYSLYGGVSVSWVFLPLLFFWFLCCVAETNRSPFDFAEGESELVSGFNIEYGSSGFALIFMAEYASILFLSLVTGIFVMGGNKFFIIAGMLVLGMSWVWLRATYPRYRYDKLMNLAWKSVLPGALCLCFFSLSVSMA